MKPITLSLNLPQPTTIKSERADIINEFVKGINKGRPCTYKDKDGKLKTVGLITPRAVAVKVGHLKDLGTLYYLLSVCKSSDNFSKKFFWELKDVKRVPFKISK